MHSENGTKVDDEVIVSLMRTFYKDGLIELVRELNKDTPQRFKEFKSVTNMRTGEPLAVSTVNNRLKELVGMGMVRQKPFHQESGKMAIGYEVTERGQEMYGMIAKCAGDMYSFMLKNALIKG